MRGRARFSAARLARVGAGLLVAALVPLAGQASPGGAQEGYAADEFSVQRRDGDQVRPRVSGRYAVWQDFRDLAGAYSDTLANAHIYGRNLDANDDFRVTSNGTSARPAVSGRRVVYTDSRVAANGLDIRGYDIENSDTFAVVETAGDQDFAAIDGPLVVWQDKRTGNWDIRGLDLDQDDRFTVVSRDGDQVKPAVSGRVVAWEDYRRGPGEPDVWYRNLDGDNDPERLTDNGESRDPAISGDWVAVRVGAPDSDDQRIRIYNWRTKESRSPMNDRTRVMGGPRIAGSLVVWSDRRNDEDLNVWAYDIATDQSFRVTGAERDQVFPDVSEKRVVWEDARGDSRDIRGARLTTPASTTPTPTGGPVVQPPPSGPCQFILGFATLRQIILAVEGNVIGRCVENEWHNATNGDGLQRVTGTGPGGLFAWRKADNWTAYTNGSITWLNGPCGLQKRPNEGPFYSWEGRIGAPCQ